MDAKTIINWCGLSVILAGSPFVIRANRANKKYAKEIESLEKHIQAWAKENNIKI